MPDPQGEPRGNATPEPGSCEICSLIPNYNDANPYFVRELRSGYVVLGWNQLYRGYTLFIAKQCVPELHLLPPEDRTLFLEEMALAAEAVFRAFTPRKLNYELLGNSVAHLHWHLFPRRETDVNPTWPIWNDPAFAAENNRRTPLEPGELAEMRDGLRAQLTALQRQQPH